MMADRDDTDPGSPADSHDMSRWKPRRRLSVLAVLLAAAVAAVVVFWQLLLVPRPRPNRMLIALHTATTAGEQGAWWADHGQASGRCADQFAAALGKLGMEIVPAGDPSTMKVLEGRHGVAQLREAARQLEAGLVLHGTIEVLGATALTGSDGRSDYAIKATLELQDVEDGKVVPLREAPLGFYQVAKSESDALRRVCERIPQPVLPLLAERLTEVPVLARLLDGERRGRGLDETVVVRKLQGFWELAERVREARQARERAAASRHEQDAKQERGKLPKHPLGPPLTEEYYLGAGPSDEAIVMALPARAVLRDDGTAAFRMQPVHEQLLRVGRHEQQRQVLREVFNVYSYPSVSSDGQWIAAVVDHRQWSKALTLVSTADGQSREVLSHGSHYFSTPRISPTGQHIVYWYSHRREGQRSLQIVAADGSGRRQLVPAGWDWMDLPEWSPDGRTVYVSYRAQDEPTASLWRIEVQSGERLALLGAATNERAEHRPADDAADEPPSFTRPAPSPDGGFIVVAENDGATVWLGRFDLGTKRYRRLALGAVGRAMVSPDSKWIAFETMPGDDADDPVRTDQEIALVTASGEQKRTLTANAQKDTLAGWSRDGKRIYFHQGARDPDGHRWNNRVYYLELAVR